MNTLAYHKYETVRDVLALGGSCKEAARIAVVSESVAHKIIAGYVPPKPMQTIDIRNVRKHRCPGCGGMVTTKPCLTCVVATT